jgi:hypothetical protein
MTLLSRSPKRGRRGSAVHLQRQGQQRVQGGAGNRPEKARASQFALPSPKNTAVFFLKTRPKRPLPVLKDCRADPSQA